MNILWVSLYPPLPLNFGGPIGIYHRVIELVKHNNVIYLFYINEDGNPEYDKKLSELCKEVHSYGRLKKMSIKLFFDCIKYPYTVATRNIKKMQYDIEKCINENHIDLINIEFPQMCINLPETARNKEIPIVLHEHNSEWSRFSQMANSSKGFRKILLRRESARLYRFEKRIENNKIVDYYSFISTEDRRNNIESFGIDKNRTILVPLGGEMKEMEELPHRGINFMFCAAMDSEMNEEGAIWFVENVFNKISNPEVRLYFVGRNPSKKVKALANDKVIVTGTVDSPDDYYKIADAVVIPLLHGDGVKIKLLEAVERGKLIITTPIGKEGTLFNSEHLLIAESAEEFLACCNLVIDRKENTKSMKERMISFFQQKYTWAEVGKEYNSNLNNCIANAIH